MSKKQQLNDRKYDYGEYYLEVICPHCHKIESHKVISHYEDRAKKIDNKIVIPLEIVSVEIFDLAPPPLCSKCTLLPKCKDCDIILCGWGHHFASQKAEQNNEYCKECWDWRLSTGKSIA
jgi:hypothetical protein